LPIVSYVFADIRIRIKLLGVAAVQPVLTQSDPSQQIVPGSEHPVRSVGLLCALRFATYPSVFYLSPCAIVGGVGKES
jgi:hypothetical protein